MDANQYKVELVSEWRNVLDSPANIALLLQQLTALVDMAKQNALAERYKTCVWREDNDKWYMTACGNAFAHMQGSYCPGCGHVIEVTL